MTDRDEVPQGLREGGALLAQVHRLSGRVFARLLKRHGLDLNPAQGRILYALWREDGLSQTELCERTKLDKSTLALMLERMEAGGQVRREVDCDDVRKKRVVLTERSLALRERWGTVSREMLDLYYADLSEQEIDAFEATLRRILSNLEKASLP